MSTALTVALTGGIAAGKSAVTRRFQALGVSVHDADVAAREVIEPGTDGLQAIVGAFGAGALDAAGRLDRRAMRQRVFADPAARTGHSRVRCWRNKAAAPTVWPSPMT